MPDRWMLLCQNSKYLYFLRRTFQGNASYPSLAFNLTLPLLKASCSPQSNCTWEFVKSLLSEFLGLPFIRKVGHWPGEFDIQNKHMSLVGAEFSRMGASIHAPSRISVPFVNVLIDLPSLEVVLCSTLSGKSPKWILCIYPKYLGLFTYDYMGQNCLL